MAELEIAAEVSIRVNGDERTVPAGLSVAALLEHLGLHPRMVVVERNGHILRRDAYADAPVEPGDAYELVHFVGGG
jgi:thiamine biosynthesis protein ThiS